MKNGLKEDPVSKGLFILTSVLQFSLVLVIFILFTFVTVHSLAKEDVPGDEKLSHEDPTSKCEGSVHHIINLFQPGLVY